MVGGSWPGAGDRPAGVHRCLGGVVLAGSAVPVGAGTFPSRDGMGAFNLQGLCSFVESPAGIQRRGESLNLGVGMGCSVVALWL